MHGAGMGALNRTGMGALRRTQEAYVWGKRPLGWLAVALGVAVPLNMAGLLAGEAGYRTHCMDR